MARIAQQRGFEFLKARFYVTGDALIGVALAKLPALTAALTAMLGNLPPHVI
ncbi:MAG: hypothetical protein WBD53_16170 [Xanthobacteraceae bacterium]